MEWMEEASCAQVDPELFFPTSTAEHLVEAASRIAIQICSDCPVKAQCLKFAMDTEGGSSVGYRFGIYGGKTPAERTSIHRRALRKAAAA